MEELLSGLVSEAFEEGVNSIKHFLQDVYRQMQSECEVKSLMEEEGKLEQIF